MSTEAQNWKLEKDLCRCCHSEGTFKSLSTIDSMMGKEIAYSDVLRNCLDIELSPVDGPLINMAYSICELCIARLQDVHNFKQQVLKCEEYFNNLYTRNCIRVGPLEMEIKQELPDCSGDDLGAEHDDCMDIAAIDEEQPKKVKSEKVARAKKRGRPNTNTRRKEVPPKELCSPDIKRKPKAPSYHLLHSDYSLADSGFKCTRCSKIFHSTNGLRIHIKSKHLALTPYTCNICNSSFHTAAPFTKHKLEQHNIDDRIKCNACDSIFNTNTQLIKHRNSFHMLGAKHKCESCDYECFSMEAMYKHKFKHKTVKDYHCKFCRKSFLRKTTLALHERIHTGDRRKVCGECGQAFVQKASLNYHMAKYHPEVKF